MAHKKKKSTIIYEGSEKPLAPKERHYVDNKKMYEAFVVYRQKVLEAKEAGKDLPRVPEFIGECFLKIATNLARKSNWIGNAHYDQELISDAVQNCITAAPSFNPDKSTNPFSYFTQTCYYAFLRRIDKEKEQTYIKFKCIKRGLRTVEMMGIYSGGDDPASKEAVSQIDSQNLDETIMDDFISSFEKKRKIVNGPSKRKRKSSTSNLEGLFTEELPSE